MTDATCVLLGRGGRWPRGGRPSGRLRTKWGRPWNEPLERSLLSGPVDAEPFDGDLIVTTVGGAIYRLDESLNVLEEVANVPNSTGLTAKDGDVWVADQLNGTILQIIDDGVTLDEPVVAFDGLAGPEGLDIRHNVLYVVEGGSQSLTSIHLESGKRKTSSDCHRAGRRAGS